MPSRPSVVKILRALCVLQKPLRPQLIGGIFYILGQVMWDTMSDFAEEIFNLLGNPNDSLRLASLVDSFELKEGSGEIPEVVVRVNRATPPSDVRWIRDTLSDYDMFYRFVVIQ